ncbi:hypothetical protein [Persephonella sp.]
MFPKIFYFSNSILILDKDDVHIKYIHQGVIFFSKRFKKDEYEQLLREEIAKNIASKFKNMGIKYSFGNAKVLIQNEPLEILLKGRAIYLGRFVATRPYGAEFSCHLYMKLRSPDGDIEISQE